LWWKLEFVLEIERIGSMHSTVGTNRLWLVYGALPPLGSRWLPFSLSHIAHQHPSVIFRENSEKGLKRITPIVARIGVTFSNYADHYPGLLIFQQRICEKE